MADTITFNGETVERGERVTTKEARGWRLMRTVGEKRYFVGSLVANETVGDERILVF